MTIGDRIISLIGFAPSNPNVVQGECTDLGLTITATYDASQMVNCKTAAVRVMEILLTTADVTNGEAGLSIKFDRAAVMQRIIQLKGELDLVDESVPSVTSRHVW